MSIRRVSLPKRHDGTYPPNRIRWACDYGHWHPSKKHAVECHRRVEKEATRRQDAWLAGR